MARHFRRRKFCRFTADGVTEIDYKDVKTLGASLLGIRNYLEPLNRNKALQMELVQ